MFKENVPAGQEVQAWAIDDLQKNLPHGLALHSLGHVQALQSLSFTPTCFSASCWQSRAGACCNHDTRPVMLHIPSLVG